MTGMCCTNKILHDFAHTPPAEKAKEREQKIVVTGVGNMEAG